MSKDSEARNIRVVAFLEAYEKQECLWNPTLNSYKIKTDREAACKQIIRELDVPNLTTRDVKLKIKGIRTTYRRELRILNKYKQLGKTYKPKLFWFKKANAFLRNVCGSRKKPFLIKDKDVTNRIKYKDSAIEYLSDGVADELPEIEDIEEESSKSELKHTSTETDCVGPMDYKTLVHVVNQGIANAEQGLKKNHSDSISLDASFTDSPAVTNEPVPPADSLQKGDEFDTFCRSVAAQLRSISDSYSRSVAKLKIQQILFEAETGHYKNSPCITIPIVQ